MSSKDYYVMTLPRGDVQGEGKTQGGVVAVRLDSFRKRICGITMAVLVLLKMYLETKDVLRLSMEKRKAVLRISKAT